MLTVLSVSHSSAFIFTQAVDEEALMSKVKQIDEFFSRFNLETGCNGNPIDSASITIDSIPSDSIMRFRNLASLLHIENFVNACPGVRLCRTILRAGSVWTGAS